jgi:hypothetical protein
VFQHKNSLSPLSKNVVVTLALPVFKVILKIFSLFLRQKAILVFCRSNNLNTKSFKYEYLELFASFFSKILQLFLLWESTVS